MNDFASFLKTKCHIPEKKIRFYLYWVAQYKELATNCEQSDGAGVGGFLEKLSRKRENWQVLQAENAISLYEYYMKSSRSPKSDSIEQASAEKLTDWQGAENELVQQLRLRHRSFSTEKTYRGWLRRFAAYLYKSREDVSQADLKRYLSYLAVERRVSASTQNQAFNALLFVFRYVFDLPVEDLEGTIRSRVRRRLPVVLSQREVALVLGNLNARHILYKPFGDIAVILIAAAGVISTVMLFFSARMNNRHAREYNNSCEHLEAFLPDDIRPHAVMNTFNNKINGSKPTIKNPVKLNCLPRAFQDNYAFRFASFLTQEINETKAA